MKYCVLNRGDQLSIGLTHKFHQVAKQYGLEDDPNRPDVVVSIGGDGTMLHAFHSFIDRLEHISFVGVHTGHLGFYADWKSEELEELVQLMAGPNPHFKSINYPLLQADIETYEGSKTYYALNEFTLRRDSGTLVAQLNLNGDKFEMFRGDGICASTPSGSTGYNKSLGGAVVHPSLETIQITEIASINNRVFRTLGSSIILPKHHYCDIFPNLDQKFVLSLDHLHFEETDIRSVRCKVADSYVRFVRYRPFPFWSRVKEAFISLYE